MRNRRRTLARICPSVPTRFVKPNEILTSTWPSALRSTHGAVACGSPARIPLPKPMLV